MYESCPNEDLQEISGFIGEYLEEFNAQNENFELFASFDFNTILQQRIGLLTSNGLVGLALVLVAWGCF